MEVGFLQETKSILKSLVLSSPNGMTLDRLNRDYREIVGSWIPFQKLGFANLELFLKSIPDTLVVSGHGREAKIGFVSNEKLKHINEMVSRQKNTTRERKVAVLHDTPQKQAEDKSRQQNSAQFNRTPLNNNYIYMCPPFQNRIIPQYPNIIQQHPNIIPQQIHINPNYILDRPVLFSVPYQNIQQSHFMASHNIKFKNKTQPDYFKKTDMNRAFNEQDKNQNVLVQKNNSGAISDKQNKITVADKPSSSKRILSEPNPAHRILTEPKAIQKQELEPSKKIVIEQRALTSIDEKKNIINTSNAIKYPKTTDKVMDDKSKQKSSLDSSNSKSKPDQQNKNAEQNKDLANTSKVKLNTDLDQRNIPKHITEQLKFPLKTKTPVILSKEFKKRTENAVQESSTSVELPRSSESKNSSFDNNVKQATTDPFSRIDSSDNDIDEAVPEFAANNLVFRVDFPENTVAFGRKIPNYELPKEIAKGSVVGVFISEIHSPFKFWFHLYKDNHELDILMNRIECFYERLYDSDLVIPKSCLAPGQVCAALYNDLWHRAEILTNVYNNKVKVHFVDYGTVSEIEIHHVKYLPTVFANTPMQAVRGSLSHIKPILPLWPKRAVREFLSMVSEVLLYAQIMEVDQKEKTVYMVLCDTNSGETVQINKQLVDRGFAKLDSEWDENKIAKNGYRKRHPRDIFPTFEMLETGEYPSLFELDQLLAQGIDYEKITEQIIFSKFNDNISDEMLAREEYATRKNTLTFNLLDSNPFKSDIISEIMSLKIFGD